jgi:hypothetical protein
MPDFINWGYSEEGHVDVGKNPGTEEPGDGQEVHQSFQQLRQNAWFWDFVINRNQDLIVLYPGAV